MANTAITGTRAKATRNNTNVSNISTKITSSGRKTPANNTNVSNISTIYSSASKSTTKTTNPTNATANPTANPTNATSDTTNATTNATNATSDTTNATGDTTNVTSDTNNDVNATNDTTNNNPTTSSATKLSKTLTTNNITTKSNTTAASSATNNPNTHSLSSKGPKNVLTSANTSLSLNKIGPSKGKMDKLKSQGKSLLLGGPKKECTICHKYIESHLHQIHVNAHPSQIFRWLYLGNFDTACNISDLRRLGITYVLNVAAECKNTLLPKSTEQLHLKMKDLEDFKVMEYFDKANEFFNKVRNSGGTMLVHCKYGVSRSPSFVAAYLIKYYGFNVESALNYIRKKRPQINPNEGFLRQLELYESTFKNKPKK